MLAIKDGTEHPMARFFRRLKPVNGIISFNTPAKLGTYENITLEFKDGKIKATANDTEKINQVLDTDEGADM